MSKNKLTEQALNAAKISDLSIQKLSSGTETLILVCPNENAAENLHGILAQHPFNLAISISEETKNYTLEFQFIESDLGMIYKSVKNEENYPPIEKLKNKDITHITTGAWENNPESRRSCRYLEPMRLGEFNISTALAKAMGVQFVAADSPEQPSAVILTFDDFEHIRSAEADEAYNRLLELTKGNPSLEINLSGDTVTLRIWDILVDFDLKIENLQYDSEQLKSFVEKVTPKTSIAFALGFIPPTGKKAAMAATKSGDIDLITFFGYVLKNNK